MVRVAQVLVVLLGLAACGDDGTAQPPATTAESTTTTAEPTTTTDPPPDPSVIPEDPADIDEKYIEAVLAELMHVEGDVLRDAVANGPNPTARALLEAIYTAEQAADQLSALAREAAGGFVGILATPGDVEMNVERVLAASPDCVAVDVNEDFSAVAVDPPSRAPSRVELLPAGVSSPSNATAWIMSVRSPLEGELAPPEPCAG